MTLRLPYRLRQAVIVTSMSGEPYPDIPEDARKRLSDPMLHQFNLLPVADQQHLLRVYVRLLEMRADDDTVTAGLIHDVGKACAKCRITVLDRGLHVILEKIAPRPYRRFAAIGTAPGWIRGLHRLANHPERGALAAEQAGYNNLVIELVRNHERDGDPGDSQLRMLRLADNSAERR